MNARVLLVEDDLTLRKALKQSLEMEGFTVDSCTTLAEAQIKLHDYVTNTTPSVPRIVIVDLGLPDGDGSELISWTREKSSVPLLVISARQDESSKVTLLDAGADDYLVKPFSMNELKARMRVALRRQSVEIRPDIGDIRVGDLEISLPRHYVKRQGTKVHLTPTEFKLLARSLLQAGRVVTHRQLLLEVWGAEYVDHVHYLRLYMAQLRAKLETDPAAPELLLTETGVGYRFCELDPPFA